MCSSAVPANSIAASTPATRATAARWSAFSSATRARARRPRWMAWSFVAAACSSSVPSNSSSSARSASRADAASASASATAVAVSIAALAAASLSSLSFLTSARAARPRWIAWSFVAAAISSSVPSKGTCDATKAEGERSEPRETRWERLGDVEDGRSSDDAVRGEEFPKAEARDRTSPSSPMVPRRTPPSDSLVSDTHSRPSRDPWGGAALAQVPGRRPARRLPGDADAPWRLFDQFAVSRFLGDRSGSRFDRNGNVTKATKSGRHGRVHDDRF